MADKLTLNQFKDKIREARAAAETKNIAESDILAPEGFVDTAKNAPEVEPAPVVEEPVAEPEQVTEKTAVETPEEPKAEQPTAEPKAVETNNQILYGRVDGYGTRTKVVGIVSRTLRHLCEHLEVAAEDNTELDSQVTFDGLVPKSKKGGVAIWEEGGAVHGSGSALIVANSDGSKPQAYRAFHDKDIFNGRHALVPVDVGSYIVVAYATPKQDTVIIYRVKDLTIRGDVADIVTELIAAAAGDEINFYDRATEEEHKLFAPQSPIVNAAYTQATTHHSTAPAYIADYSPAHLDETDYWDAIADSGYRSILKKYNTLADAYQAAGEYLAHAVDNCGKKDDALIITTIDIPDGHEDTVRVFISGVVYTKNDRTNAKRGSSEGQRGFYARVILQGDDILYYADKDIEHGVSVPRALAVLNSKKNANGVRLPMVNTMKRMTGAQY